VDLFGNAPAVAQALARKYRPRSFAGLSGQEHVVRALANALDQGRLHHAWLLTGTRGVGKTTLARILAKALNCERGVSSTPCGECTACLEIEAGRFIDLIELDAASNTGIDNMRELLENAVYAPTAGRYKVYIIDEVHMLSRGAFNSMLKTLEEPPAHVKFVLATTDPQKIPVTVLSRCLQFNLKHIPRPQIAQRLAQVLEAEGVAHEPAALALLARAAQGSLRDALSLADQAVAHGAGAVTEASTRAMLGALERDHLYALADALGAADGRRLLAEAERLAERGVDLETVLRELAGLLHRVAIAQIVPEAIAADDPDRAALESLVARLAAEDVQLWYQIAIQGAAELPLAPDEYAGFTMALLRMLAFRPGELPAQPLPADPPGHAPQVPAAAPDRPDAAPPPAVPASAATATAAPEAPAPAAGTALTPGNWRAFVDAAGLTGMARMLAEHTELVSFDGTRIVLRLPEEHAHVGARSYQDKLKAGLDQYLGRSLALRIESGRPSGATPREQLERELDERQRAAVRSIEQDPFVRDLVDNLGAQVRADTIKPAN
jgi:DNA polymerase-3 subunit gamma/tau